MPPAELQTSRKSSGWRKESPTVVEGQRAWQTPAEEQSYGRRPSRSGQRFMVALLALIFAGLAGLFLYELILVPIKTPFVAVLALDYRWPLPPNAWAREDVDDLKKNLDQTLDVQKIDLGGAAVGELLSGRTGIVRRVEFAAAKAPPSGAVVIYLSGQGALDASGTPCLLPANADPADANTWLHLPDLLQQIKAFKSRHDVHYLLVIDANRQDENWAIGLLQNGFAARLAESVAKAAVPRLAVINSTSEGEVAWTSSRMHGSIFGHYLQLGLAGAADDDKDGRVTLRELEHYINKNVDSWAIRHRAARQQPQLSPVDAADFQVAWSLNPRDLAELVTSLPPPDGREVAAAAAKLDELWRMHQQLLTRHPQHYAAWNWQQIEHDLLWLEQAATAGGAYKPAFDQILLRVQTELNRAHEVAAGQFAPAKFAAAISADDSVPLADLKVASRPLAEYLGIAASQPAERFSEEHFARLVDHYGVDHLWPDSDVKSKALALYELSSRRGVPQSDENTPDDLRAQALVRPLLDQCDRDRRLAEDNVFLGPQQAPDLAKQLEECRQRYEEIGATEMAFAEAYHARDRAWRELPYLARWSAWQDAVADSDSQVDNKQRAAGHSKDKLLAMLDATNRLDRSLQEAEDVAARPTDAKTVAALSTQPSGAAHEVNENLDALRGELLAAARRLPLASADAKTLREMQVVLATPLVSGNARNVLLAKYLDTMESVDGMIDGNEERSSESPPSTEESGSQAKEAHHEAAKTEEPKPSAAPAVAVESKGESKAESSGESKAELKSEAKSDAVEIPTVANWTTHPVAVLLAKDKAQIAANNQDLPALGEKLRAILLRVTHAPPADASIDLPAADRDLRQFVVMAPVGEANPALRIERRQLQDLVLWHCARVLDDFWGSLTPGREPFFAEAAEAYLVGARLLAHPDPIVERKLQALAATWETRRRAAARALSTTATDLVLIDAQSEATAQVSIRSGPEAAGLPPGAAAVYLRESVVPIPHTVHRMDVGPGLAEHTSIANNLAITVAASDLANRAAMLQAVAMFRGHEFPAPLMQREVAGRRIEVDRHLYGSSRVTVRGDRVKRASLVFILDCSHSMEDPVPVEGPDSPDRIGHRAKLDVAVDALENMLRRLGEQGDVRVGVRFFGHRVGWRTDKADALARQENYPGGVPPTLRPYADVELFLPLGRFDAGTATGVAKRLHALKPWGESPIYLSLVEALKDFGSDDAQGQQRVVVITDGMNYQFNPPPESSPSLKEVQAAYASRGVSVDIVGFGIPDEERLTAVKEFTQLAETSHGSFTLAMNASALVRRLEQVLVKTQFSVADEAGHGLQQAELGGTVTVAASAAKPLDCDISVDDLRTRSKLVGGEALQLFVSRLGRRILCPPYEDDNPMFAPLVTAEPTSPTGYHIGAHRARPETAAALFPISFQREDQNIPQRPAQVWIEIVPQVQGRVSSDEGYAFYDETFEGDMPVPVMHCRCGNWPKEADQAAVRVWCAERPVEPDEIVPLAQVADQTPPSGEGFELKTIGGVSYQVHWSGPPKEGERMRVRVVERHRPGVPIHVMKVEMYPPPRHIVHQFDAEHGIVLHAFELDAPTGKSDPAPELRFTSRARFTDAAWRIEQPLTLAIARHSEVVLPPRILDSEGK